MQKLLSVVVLSLLAAFAVVQARPAMVPAPSERAVPLPISKGLLNPIVGFRERITKEPFGIFWTVENWPAPGRHFGGYHTGVDIEYADTTAPIPVYAIADGTIMVREWATGYGGVMVIRHVLNGTPVYALYGHLNQASFLPASITEVTAGQQIAVLGADHSHQTGGSRKHLHFSISKTDTLDIRGYVHTPAELTHWYNPLDFYK